MQTSKFKIRVKCIIMAVLMLIATFDRQVEEIYAIQNDKEIRYIRKNEFEKAKKYKYTSKKVEEELRKKTNVLDEKVERHLNEQGLFDKEILSI